VSEVKAAPDLANWPVAILAGGLATRLRPVTESIPKALVEVADEPFVVHQLRLLRAVGFRRVVLCVGHLAAMIEGHLRDGRSFGLEISYSYDGEILRGTGGALRHAGSLLGERFVVLYGDSYLPIDYAEVISAYCASDLPALMTVYRNEGRWDTSNVSFDGNRVRAYSKATRTPEMNYIDYGLGVIRAEVLKPFRERRNFDLAEVYTRLAEVGALGGFEVKQRFYEIGSPGGLQELDLLLRQEKNKASL
jgi:NDP-sugar pyrophosphorylase family protein